MGGSRLVAARGSCLTVKKPAKDQLKKKDYKIVPQPVNEVSDTKQRNFEVHDVPDAVTTGVLTAKIEIIKILKVQFLTNHLNSLTFVVGPLTV